MGWDKTILANKNPNILKGVLKTRSGNILRFPRAAGEPPRARRVASISVVQHSSQIKTAVALWGLTDAFAPANLYGGTRNHCTVVPNYYGGASI